MKYCDFVDWHEVDGKINYEKYILSKQWRAIRRLVLRRDGYKCIKCGGNNNTLHVHHKTYQHLGDESDHLEDLETLCVICHKKLHSKNRDKKKKKLKRRNRKIPKQLKSKVPRMKRSLADEQKNRTRHRKKIDGVWIVTEIKD
jgi:5-methylcytosine-specific restriction endonuclease McrA